MNFFPMNADVGGVELHEYNVTPSSGTVTLPSTPKLFVAVYASNAANPSYNNAPYGCFYDVVNKQSLVSQYVYISDVTANIITFTADQGAYWKVMYA